MICDRLNIFLRIDASQGFCSPGSKGIDYEVEKCRQCGEAVSFGVLFIPDSHTGKKGKDVVLGD